MSRYLLLLCLVLVACGDSAEDPADMQDVHTPGAPEVDAPEVDIAPSPPDISGEEVAPVADAEELGDLEPPLPDVPPEEPYDEVPLLPSEAFLARQADSLERCHDASGPGGGVYGQACRVVRGAETYNEEAIEEACTRLDERRDTADFRLAALVRMLFLDRTHNALPQHLLERIEGCVLNFKYWLDEPGHDKMCYWTENHQALFFSGELLAGHLFPDEVFPNASMTGREHADKAHPRVLRWLDERIRFGFSEWHSNIYFNEDIPALLNLIDFAEDPEIRTKAAMVLDILLFDILNNSYRGALATVFGRTSASKFFSGLTSDSSSPAAWVLLGLGEPRSPTNFGAAFAATSVNYHPPVLLEEIAEASRDNHEHRQRDGIDVADGPKYGIGYEDDDDIVFWAGMAGLVAPEVIEGTMAFLDRHDLWDGFLFGDLPEDIRDLLQGLPRPRAFADLVRPISQGIALESMSTYVYRTPHYQLAGGQDHKPGFFGAQTLMWMAALDHDAFVFTKGPVDLDVGGAELGVSFGGDWIGGWKPRVTMHRNVGVIQYRKPDVPVADPFVTSKPSHAFFPRAAMDEVREENGWVFGRKDEGYVALYSALPTHWAEDNDYQLISDSTDNTWIVELGSLDERGDFDTFVTEIASAPLAIDGSVAYTSPSVGQIEVAWEGPMVVDGVEVALGPFERFDNAYCRQEFDTRRTIIEHDGVRLDLDMEAGTRRMLVRREQ